MWPLARVNCKFAFYMFTFVVKVIYELGEGFTSHKMPFSPGKYLNNYKQPDYRDSKVFPPNVWDFWLNACKTFRSKQNGTSKQTRQTVNVFHYSTPSNNPI